MERGQERLGLKSICGYVVNDNLGKVECVCGRGLLPLGAYLGGR